MNACASVAGSRSRPRRAGARASSSSSATPGRKPPPPERGRKTSPLLSPTHPPLKEPGPMTKALASVLAPALLPAWLMIGWSSPSRADEVAAPGPGVDLEARTADMQKELDALQSQIQR